MLICLELLMRMNISQSIKLINNYFNKKYSIDVEIIESQELDFGDGFVLFEEAFKDKSIFIGTKDIQDVDLNHSEITLLAKSCSHEKHHIFQKFRTFRKPGDISDRECAKEVLFYRNNIGLYLYNYEFSLHEIEAEGSALLTTPTVIQDLFPDINPIYHLENYLKNIQKDKSLVSFVERSPSATYLDTLKKFDSLLIPDNFPKKRFDFSKINTISINKTGHRDIICRFLDSTGKISEFEKYINSLQPIEQNTTLLAMNLLSIQPDIITFDKYNDFNNMYKNYKVIDKTERCIINNRKEFLKELLNINPERDNLLNR